MKLRNWTLGLPVLALWAVASLAGAAEEKILNVYNWVDYVAKDTVSNFEKETGIRVRYDMYDSNEVLQGKLLTGKSGYDVVVVSADFAGKQIQSGVYLAIDKKELSNYSNLDPKLLKKLQPSDAGNAHLVPYMWGTTAIGVNVKKLDHVLGKNWPADAWRLVFDPAVTSKLKSCGISFMDMPSEVLSMVNLYLGRAVSDYSKTALDAATAQLLRVRRDVRVFNSAPIDLLANGDVCVALMYNGDAYIARNRAQEAKNGQEIAYITPKKGTVLWIDSLAIPKDARHPQNALKFINYLLRPRVAANITNETFFASANLKAAAMVDKIVLEDANIYPIESLRAKLSMKKVLSAQQQRDFNRRFSLFKTSKNLFKI